MADVSRTGRGGLVRYLALIGILVILAVGYLVWSQSARQRSSVDLRLSVPPFVDTAFTEAGLEHGVFGPLGQRLKPVATTWENQYSILAAGGLDISMSTLDEFVNKSKNLRAIGKPIVYILPAWKFRGLGFYTAGQVQPLASPATPEARASFLRQLKGKKIVLPQGSVFDEAFKAFLRGTNVRYEDLQNVNAPLESALNSLGDTSVAVVAVGSQQRFEAERRGYKEAISPEALGLDVITGFVV